MFAIYGPEYRTLGNEIIMGIGFFVVTYIGYRLNCVNGLTFLEIGYIAHVAYDVIHNLLFSNTETPTWWAELCGSVDVLIGLYLLNFAITVKDRATKLPNNRVNSDG